MITYSDACQDIFALSLFNNNKLNFFLDIGCADGVSASNSLLLEQYGWSGILIDNRLDQINLSKQKRINNNIHCIDATDKYCLEHVLEISNCPETIDYISLDIDHFSFTCLERFPFDKYKFKFMTFEHDLYTNHESVFDRKYKAPELLKSFGYEKLIDNILVWGRMPYEDWYISNEYTDIIDLFQNLTNVRPEKALDTLLQSGLKI